MWEGVRMSLLLATRRKIAGSTEVPEVAAGDPGYRKRAMREHLRPEIASPLGPLAIGTSGKAILSNGTEVKGIVAEGRAISMSAETKSEIQTLKRKVDWLVRHSTEVLQAMHEVKRMNHRLRNELGLQRRCARERGGGGVRGRMANPWRKKLRKRAGNMTNN